MTDLSASPAGISDAALLAALHSEILRADWPAESIAHLLALPGAFALVAIQRADETPVGETPVGKSPVDNTPVGYAICVPGGEGFDVAALGVVSGVRRQGIGRFLVAEAIDLATRAGGRELTLEVAAGNSAARRLYGACGFVEIALRPGYYTCHQDQASQDAVVMRLSLI